MEPQMCNTYSNFKFGVRRLAAVTSKKNKCKTITVKPIMNENNIHLYSF